MPRSDSNDCQAVVASELPVALQTKARAAAQRAQTYLCGRQSPGGGFCFYRWMGVEEPTLRDTWHAVAALTLVGAEVPRRDEVEAFLRAFDATGLDDLYHRAFALGGLGTVIERQQLERIASLDACTELANDHVPVSERLKRTLRIIRLQRRFVELLAPLVIAERVLDMCWDGGWGDKPNLCDTCVAISILDACGGNVVLRDVRTFIDALQISAFGFTATRDSTYAPLEVVHAGLRACSLLQLPIHHLSDAVGCVLACQSSNGGFARTSDALPDIALTHLGLLALAAAGVLSAAASSG